MSRAVPANANHRVPEHARVETARTLADAGIRGSRPTPSADGRCCDVPDRRAATVRRRRVPFGSLVAYAVDDAGQPLLCLSDLAEHSRNLAAEPGRR